MNLATEERPEEVVRADNRTARLGGTDIFRGALVILTAIVIGGFVVSRGLDQSDEAEVASSESADADAEAGAGDGTEGEAADEQAGVTTSEVTVPDTTIAAAPAETAPPETVPEEVVPAAPVARLPAEVKVLVLNGAQTQGIAARGTEALKAASYLTAAPKNATAQQASAILWAEGYELDAIAVAGVFGAGLEGIVQPLDLANVPIDDTQGSNVIVVVGPDGVIPIP